MTRSAPAKINLTLRVGSVRPDGFHEIESLVARVGLCDTVSVARRDDARFTLACDDASIPSDSSNLALRAARRLAEAAGVRGCGVHVTLRKRIPAGAGLGGGSSNAAATLTLLNELWALGLPVSELATTAAEIGSDVPLFFHSPLCIIRGRGERVEDLRRSLTGWAVLILPALRSATRDVYGEWDRTASHPPRPSVSEVLQHADHAATLMPCLFNDLEGPAFAVEPELAELAQGVRAVADDAVRMTGSGSALFRLFDNLPAAKTFADRVRAALNPRVEVVPLETA